MKGIAQPKVSVIICTWNRCHDLERALQALARQTLPASDYEIIAVDNNSTDPTAQVVREFASQTAPKMRYLFERRQGKVYALNTGIAAAQAPILALTDDDCVPEPNWLEALVKPFADPRVGVVAGKALSQFALEVVADPFRKFLANKFFGDFGFGDQQRILRGRESPLGASMGCRAEAVRQVNGFSEQLGHRAGIYGGFEESDLTWRIREIGYQVIYVPDALVRHHIPSSRIEAQSIRRSALAIGRNSYLAGQRQPISLPVRLMRIGLCLLELLFKSLRWLVNLWSPGRRFVAEFRLRCCLGKFSALMSGK